MSRSTSHWANEHYHNVLSKLPEGALTEEERIDFARDVNLAYRDKAEAMSLVPNTKYANGHYCIKMDLIRTDEDGAVEIMVEGYWHLSSAPVKEGDADKDAARQATLDVAGKVRTEADMHRVDTRDFGAEMETPRRRERGVLSGPGMEYKESDNYVPKLRRDD